MPSDIYKEFEKEDNIKEILKENIIASGIRKLRAQSAVHFFDSGAMKLLVELFNPQTKSVYSIKPMGNPVNPIKDNFINEYIALCPYVEDIVALSKLKYRTKARYERALLGMIAPAKKNNNTASDIEDQGNSE
jgi:hypothetical protein